MTAPTSGPYIDAATAALAKRMNLTPALVKATGPEKSYGSGQRLITAADVQRARAQADRRVSASIGPVPHDPIPGTIGGHPSLKVQVSSIAERWATASTRRVTVDVFALNPLLDDVTLAAADVVARARSRSTPPTLFTAGNLPLFTAAGLAPALLLRLPFLARHPAAQGDTSEASRIFESFATNDPGAWYRAVNAFDAHPANVAYKQRILDWLTAPPPAGLNLAGPSAGPNLAAVRADPGYQSWRA